MKISRFIFNPFQECCYVASAQGRCVIIDPGCHGEAETGMLTGALEREGLTPAAILLTHAHPDHVLGVGTLVERYGLSVYMGAGEEETLADSARIRAMSGLPSPSQDWTWTVVRDEEELDFGEGLHFTVIATPGHTPGGVCYHCPEQGVLFSGDTLFAGAIGRTDLPGGDYDQEIVSIMEKLIWLDGGTEIFPGHGPSSTIARERAHNPFLEPFNEPEETPDPDLEPVVIDPHLI